MSRSAETRILSTMRSADGQGIVRTEDRFDTGIEDLWSALTEPDRLARWVAEVKGDLRPGGEFTARFTSQWEGTGRVEVCEPPRHLTVVTRQTDDPRACVIDATLTADGDQTILVVEHRGVPVEQLAGYGSGVQIHFEDLGAYLAGAERCDIEARWNDLMPVYERLRAADTPRR